MAYSRPERLGYESLRGLLEPMAGGRTGKEKEVRLPLNPAFRLYVDPFGSLRFVRFAGSDERLVAVAAMQVMSRDDENGLVVGVYTRPEYRGRRFASELLHVAAKFFPGRLEIATDRSEAGKAWCEWLEARRPDAPGAPPV